MKAKRVINIDIGSIYSKDLQHVRLVRQYYLPGPPSLNQNYSYKQNKAMLSYTS